MKDKELKSTYLLCKKLWHFLIEVCRYRIFIVINLFWQAITFKTSTFDSVFRLRGYFSFTLSSLWILDKFQYFQNSAVTSNTISTRQQPRRIQFVPVENGFYLNLICFSNTVYYKPKYWLVTSQKFYRKSVRSLDHFNNWVHYFVWV